jgi:hypothetical protein
MAHPRLAALPRSGTAFLRRIYAEHMEYKPSPM